MVAPLRFLPAGMKSVRVSMTGSGSAGSRGPTLLRSKALALVALLGALACAKGEDLSGTGTGGGGTTGGAGNGGTGGAGNGGSSGSGGTAGSGGIAGAGGVDPKGNANRNPGFVDLSVKMGAALPATGSPVSPAPPSGWL